LYRILFYGKFPYFYTKKVKIFFINLIELKIKIFEFVIKKLKQINEKMENLLFNSQNYSESYENDPKNPNNYNFAYILKFNVFFCFEFQNNSI
jgi:hypothetical protein